MSRQVLVTGMIVQFTNTSAVAAADKKDVAAAAGKKERVNLAKAQQGFGVLSVALASQVVIYTHFVL